MLTVLPTSRRAVVRSRGLLYNIYMLIYTSLVNIKAPHMEDQWILEYRGSLYSKEDRLSKITVPDIYIDYKGYVT